MRIVIRDKQNQAGISADVTKGIKEMLKDTFIKVVKTKTTTSSFSTSVNRFN